MGRKPEYRVKHAQSKPATSTQLAFNRAMFLLQGNTANKMCNYAFFTYFKEKKQMKRDTSQIMAPVIMTKSAPFLFMMTSSETLQRKNTISTQFIQDYSHALEINDLVFFF